MIDTVVDDYVPASGLRRCCIMDAIAQSVLQDEETKNNDKSSKFLSAQEEKERKKEGRLKRQLCYVMITNW